MKSHLSILSGIALFVLCGCTTDADELFSSADDSSVFDTSIESRGISRSTADLTATEAAEVAKMFRMESKLATDLKDLTVEVLPLKDSDGRIGIYAVNFVDGYVLVSASRNSYPIQGYSEHGKYSLVLAPEACTYIMKDMLTSITSERVVSMKQTVSTSWTKYVKHPASAPSKTATYVDPDLTDARKNKMYELEDREYEVYDNWEFTEDIPARIVSNFRNIVERRSEAFKEETGQDANFAWILAVKHTYSGTNTGIMCSTRWDQGYPYNGESPFVTNNLGCVTIAVAQIMKYHRYPATFNWAQMPDRLGQEGDTPLSLFLRRLKGELKVNSSGGAKNSQAIEVLTNYGYTAGVSKTISSLPIYAGAEDNNTDNPPHVWVIDGRKQSDIMTIYELYFPSDRDYSSYEYECISEDFSSPAVGPNYYHMNWGWGGKNDGWYIDAVTENYNKNRNYIVVRKP